MSNLYKSMVAASLAGLLTASCVERPTLHGWIVANIPQGPEFTRYDTKLGPILAKSIKEDNGLCLQLVLEPNSQKSGEGVAVIDCKPYGLEPKDGVLRLYGSFDQRLTYHFENYEAGKHHDIRNTYIRMLREMGRVLQQTIPKQKGQAYSEHRNAIDQLMAKLKKK